MERMVSGVSQGSAATVTGFGFFVPIYQFGGRHQAWRTWHASVLVYNSLCRRPECPNRIPRPHRERHWHHPRRHRCHPDWRRQGSPFCRLPRMGGYTNLICVRGRQRILRTSDKGWSADGGNGDGLDVPHYLVQIPVRAVWEEKLGQKGRRIFFIRASRG